MEAVSTKIFDAYILPAGACTTTRALLSFSKRIRAALGPVSKRLAYEAMALKLATTTDLLTLGVIRRPEHSPFKIVAEEMQRARANLRDGRREISWDFNLEWTFFCAPGGRVLLKLFGEDAMCRAFERTFPAAKEYHYQNSTDRPKDVTSQEWAQRKHDWDKATGDGPYCSNGLSMRLWGEYDGPLSLGAEEVLIHVSGLSRKQRAAAAATEVAVRDWAQIEHENNGADFDGSGVFAFLRLYADADNADLRRVFTREVQRLLIPRIARKHLCMTGSELANADVADFDTADGADESLMSAQL